MKYNTIHTTEIDEKFMPKSPGAINGEMYNRNDGGSEHPVIVITVKNIDESIKKIQEGGGKIVFNKRQVGDMGLYAQFQDTEGNILGVWENLKKQ